MSQGEAIVFDRAFMPENSQGLIVYGFNDDGNNYNEEDAKRYYPFAILPYPAVQACTTSTEFNPISAD